MIANFNTLSVPPPPPPPPQTGGVGLAALNIVDLILSPLFRPFFNIAVTAAVDPCSCSVPANLGIHTSSGIEVPFGFV